MIGTRPATLDDAHRMAAIHATAFSEAWDASVMASFLRAAGTFGLVAVSSAAGFVLCRRIANEAEILTLAVNPANRRQGVGSALLAGALDWARETATDAMFLEVARDNDGALALYRASAFVEVGRRRAYYSRATGAMDALVLRLDLNR